MNGSHYESNVHYDAVIVGSGVAGSLIAKQLGDRGWRVLVLEAGTGGGNTWAGYQAALDTYRSALSKGENSPYLPNPAAPSPDEAHLGIDDPASYFVQTLKDDAHYYNTTYLRARGGSMLHWQGVSLRMFAEDFTTETFGHGRNWPISMEKLVPYYERAEFEIGVSGDADSQREVGLPFGQSHRRPPYQYPMKPLPQSYLDRKIAYQVNGTKEITVKLSDFTRKIEPNDPTKEPKEHHYRPKVRPVPQGRNSTPNLDYTADYNDGQGYRPVGAVGLPNYGERCHGNSSCIPICPVQAKYNPLKTQAKFNPDKITLATHSVVTSVLFADGLESEKRAIGVEYKVYDDPRSPAATEHRADGDVIILAAHAIENAKILLASGARNRNDHGNGPIGRNLMDHPIFVTWGLMPGNVGPFRGPMSTSSIDDFRTGGGRYYHAPFRIESENWGWSWPVESPITDVRNLIYKGNEGGKGGAGPVFGSDLRARLAKHLSRQIQLSFLIEQPADPNNRVTLDPDYRDNFGNYRPVIHWSMDDYVLNGFAAATQVYQQIFTTLDVEDWTMRRENSNVLTVAHKGKTYGYRGGGHGAGTHIMGSDQRKSVVNEWQRCYGHPNLYAVGSGSMPSMGTSNPSLTLAALALRTADDIDKYLITRNRPIATLTSIST
ncbi:MAG: FAD-dependent oxidoreductase [Pseudonocardiaceae bacterium]